MSVIVNKAWKPLTRLSIAFELFITRLSWPGFFLPKNLPDAALV